MKVLKTLAQAMIYETLRMKNVTLSYCTLVFVLASQGTHFHLINRRIFKKMVGSLFGTNVWHEKMCAKMGTLC